MTSLDKKTRKPAELSSIINVVRRNSKGYDNASDHSTEMKSIAPVNKESWRKTDTTQSQPDVSKCAKSSDSVFENPVLLHPFGHQVSGRASILCYDETTLLKPYVSRELYFYQSIPRELKKFAPQFRGLVNVSFVQEGATSSIRAYALPRTLVKPDAKSIIKLFAEKPKPHSKRCVKDYGKTHVIYPDQSVQKMILLNKPDTSNSGMFVEPMSHVPTISSANEDDDVVSELSQGFDVSVCIDDSTESGKENREQQTYSTAGLHNPWNAKVLDDAWLKLKYADSEDPAYGKKKKFTLLENVVARYRRPCVLDLKIGTRIRETASPEKIARHVTAIHLGARLSGMQIYRPDKEKFLYHNKYYGHNLTVAGFLANLRHFFSRGTHPIVPLGKNQESASVDESLVKQAIKKIENLKEIIESMKSHRFYSSSLLLLYEGDVTLSTEDTTSCAIHDSETSAEAKLATSADSCSKTPQRSPSISELVKRLKRGSNEYGKRSRENSPKDTKNENFRTHLSGTCPDHDKRHCDVLSDSVGSNKSNHRKSLKSNGSAHKITKSLTNDKRGKSRKSKSSDDIIGNSRSNDRSKSVVLCEKFSAKDDSSITNHAGDSYIDCEYTDKMECDNCVSLDVRMIDYAHYCYDDGALHPGPDSGFLFGLDNLIALLREMLES